MNDRMENNTAQDVTFDQERFELACGRLSEIAQEKLPDAAFTEYFTSTARQAMRFVEAYRFVKEAGLTLLRWMSCRSITDSFMKMCCRRTMEEAMRIHASP